MFEISLSDPVELRDADDAALLAAIEDCARAEVAAGARRLSAIAELTSRRTGNDQRADWACDGWDCAAAEVAAALSWPTALNANAPTSPNATSHPQAAGIQRWRRDLNPRTVLAVSRFQGECIRPLCHATADKGNEPVA